MQTGQFTWVAGTNALDGTGSYPPPGGTTSAVIYPGARSDLVAVYNPTDAKAYFYGGIGFASTGTTLGLSFKSY